jgi:uncharacterized protein YggT (Ycf19 family)
MSLMAFILNSAGVLLDFILNLAGILLWLNWRSIRFDPYARATPATLVGTLRRIEAPRLKCRHFLAALGGLLFARAIFYALVGPVNWTPKINLVVVTLAFPLTLRGHHFWSSAMLFSALSFTRALLIFYFWLLALAFINRRMAVPDSFQKMLLLLLGRASRWPRMVQAILPLLTVAALWFVLYPLLVYEGVTSRAHSNAHLAEQSLLVGMSIYFSLKFLLPAFLFVHLIANYVYLGGSPFWDFVSSTARNILVPLNRLPLRFGKVDFAPLAGIILLLLLLHALPIFILDVLNLTLWPG